MALIPPRPLWAEDKLNGFLHLEARASAANLTSKPEKNGTANSEQGGQDRRRKMYSYISDIG